MTKYLISFPSPAMVIDPQDFAEVAEAARTVIREANAAGVYVFGGGIDEGIAPVMVSADGTVTAGTYPQTRHIEGGFTVLELPTVGDAHAWAAKIARACRCAQEVRAFQYDPES